MPLSSVVGYSLQNTVVSTHPQIERWHATGPTGDAEVFFFDKEKLNQLKSLPRWGPFGQFHAGESDGRAYLVVTDVLENNLINLKADLTEGELIGLLWHVSAALAEVHNNGNAHGLLSVNGIGLNEAGQLRILPDPEQLFFEDPDDQASAVAIDSVLMGKIFTALGLEGGQDPHKQLLLMGLNQDMARLRLQPAAAIRQAISALTSRNPDWEKKLIERFGEAFSFDRLPKPEKQPSPRKSSRHRRAKVNENEIWDYTPYGERLSSELTRAESIGQSLLRESFATDSVHSVDLEDDQLPLEPEAPKEESSSIARIQIPIFQQEDSNVLSDDSAWNDLDSDSEDIPSPASISVQSATAFASVEPVAVAIPTQETPLSTEAVTETDFGPDPETSETAAWAASFAQAQLAEQKDQELEFENYRPENTEESEISNPSDDVDVPDNESVVFERVDGLLEDNVESDELEPEDIFDAPAESQLKVDASDDGVSESQMGEESENTVLTEAEINESHLVESLDSIESSLEESAVLEVESVVMDEESSVPFVESDSEDAAEVSSDADLSSLATLDFEGLIEAGSEAFSDEAESVAVDEASSDVVEVSSDAVEASSDEVETSSDADLSSLATLDFEGLIEVGSEASSDDPDSPAEADAEIDSVEFAAEENPFTTLDMDALLESEVALSSDVVVDPDSEASSDPDLELVSDPAANAEVEDDSLTTLELESLLEAEVEFDSEDSSERESDLASNSEVEDDSLITLDYAELIEAEVELDSEAASEADLDLDAASDLIEGISSEQDESDLVSLSELDSASDDGQASPEAFDFEGLSGTDLESVSEDVAGPLVDDESDPSPDPVLESPTEEAPVSTDEASSKETFDFEGLSGAVLDPVPEDASEPVVDVESGPSPEPVVESPPEEVPVTKEEEVSLETIDIVEPEPELVDEPLSDLVSDPVVESDVDSPISDEEPVDDFLSLEEESEESLISDTIAQLEASDSPDDEVLEHGFEGTGSQIRSREDIHETIVPSLDSAKTQEPSLKEKFESPLRKTAVSAQPKWASLAENHAPGSSEDELGAGKWTESGRSVAEIEKTLSGTSVREFEIDQGGSAWGMFIVAIVVAVVLAVAAWSISEKEEQTNLDSIVVPEDVMEAVPSVTRTVSVETTPESGMVIFDDIQYGTAPINIPLPEDYDQEHTLCVQWGEDRRSCRQVKRGDFSSGVYKFEATR